MAEHPTYFIPNNDMAIKNSFKKSIGIMLAGGMVVFTGIRANAVVANPDPCTFTQPDGTEVTLRLFGDESYNYTMTADGYAVVLNDITGIWEYAELSTDGMLVSTGIGATDGKKAPARSKGVRPVFRQNRKQKMPERRRYSLETGQYDYDSFRGLVILVEYNDTPFSRNDIQAVFDDMINKSGYDGYMTDHMIPTKVEYTGSVRDYYYENSGGVFDPRFDVVGPVKIDYSRHYARQTAGAQALVGAALRAADSEVDYSVYDTDGNREVDMVYFIFSGAGSNFAGNEETLIWPHASMVMNLSLDGVSFGRYACSTELYGAPANKLLDGIGTICHEFSHVLGLPDLYDVDYETGGQAEHPSKWSVMASGSYLNKSRTPCGYSLFERYALGFATPRLITQRGEYNITPLNDGDTPDGCRINSAVENEFFLLESRTKTRWDEYLPGEGLLVHRVDSTNTAVWENNRVNATSGHTYYTLLRASPKMSGTTITDSDGDPFPGSGNVTRLDNASIPSLRSWTMQSTPFVIDNIEFTSDGTVTFSVMEDDVPTLVEDFANMSPTTGDAKGISGKFASWNFSKGARIEAMEDSENTVLTTIKGSEAECSAIDAKVENVSIRVNNATTSNAIFRLYSSIDNGLTWVPVNTVEGSANPSVRGGETVTLHYNTGALEKPAFRLAQFTGSASARCAVELMEITVMQDKESGVRVLDEEADQECGEVKWYSISGYQVSAPNVPGIYIKVSGRASKVHVMD